MSLSCYFLKLIRSPQLIDISVTKNEVEIEIEEKLSELVKNIPFQNIITNETETVWEYILNEGLFFLEFERMNALTVSLCDLRDKYYANLSSPLHTAISLEKEEKLYQIINDYYGTSILPETNLTLDKIDLITPPLEERMNTPVSHYKAETYLRATKCQESQHPSRDMLYQTARAADDTVKILAKNNGSLEEMLFFPILQSVFIY